LVTDKVKGDEGKGQQRMLFDELTAEADLDAARSAKQSGTMVQDDISAMFQQGREE